MGRPKEFKSDIVIKAATDCFWDAGVRGTSISSLVEAMNIQRSSFYNSFKSRDAIYGQVLAGYLKDSPLSSFAGVQDASDRAKPDLALLDLVLEFSDFLIAQGRGRGCLFFNGLAELRKDDGPVYELLQEHLSKLAEQLASLLNAIEKESAQDAPLGQLDLHQLLTLLIGISHYSKQVHNAERIKSIALNQLAGLSPHFAQLIQKQDPSVEAMAEDVMPAALKKQA